MTAPTAEQRVGQFWAHVLAVAMGTLALAMIIAGATVTTIQAADSDPTWSVRFWEWFARWLHAPGGQRYELLHRMIGTVIGFLAFATVVLVWLFENRRWVRLLAGLLLLAVIGQGLLGAARVLVVSDEPGVQQYILNSTGTTTVKPWRLGLAVIHGIWGQLTFGLMVTLALVTSRGWINPPQRFGAVRAGLTRGVAVTMVAAIATQLALGAVYRHAQWPQAFHGHLVGAALVLGLAVALWRIAHTQHYEAFPIRQPAFLIVFLVGMQVALGGATWLMTRHETIAPPPQSLANLIVSGHVATGAMILAVATVVALRSFHIIVDRGTVASG